MRASPTRRSVRPISTSTKLRCRSRRTGEVLVRTTLLSLDPASRAWMHGPTYRSHAATRRSDGRMGHRRSRQVERQEFEPGDLVSGEYGWQQYRRGARARADQARQAPQARTHSRRARHHRPHRLFRHARSRPAAPRRNRSGLGRGGRRRLDRRTDRQDRRAAASSARRAARTNANGWSTNSASMPPSTTSPAICTRRSRRPARNGIDVYFDNTGGEVLAAALSRMNMLGPRRLLRRDLAIQHGDAGAGTGRRAGIARHQAHPHGRLRRDGLLQPPRAGRSRARPTGSSEGKIKAPVDIVEGFEKMPSALAGMFAGKNRGKLMVRV